MPTNFRAMLTNRIASLALPFLLLVPCVVQGQDTGTGTCTVKDYKIMSASAIALHCSGDTANLVIQNISLYSLTNVTITPLTTSVAMSHFLGATRWLLLTLGSTQLMPKQKYRLSLTYTVIDSAGHSSTPTEYTDIDTTAIVSITLGLIKGQLRLYTARSHVGFSAGGGRLAWAGFNPDQPCEIPLKDDTKKRSAVSGRCSSLNSLNSNSPTAAELANVDPNRVGLYVITLNEMPTSNLIPSKVGSLQDIFGGTLQIDPKSRFSPQKAPATKEAASYYIAAYYAAGVGTVPAWVLDGKIAPESGLHNGFTFSPVALADVGNNKLKGQTYTNTVDLGGTAQRLFQPNKTLQELLFSPGVTYETDKEFDRDNFLAVVDLRYNFANLYRTQSIATLQKYHSLLEESRRRKETDPKAHVIEPQLDDIKQASFGYALDFHTGIEAGGSLIDTTVKASVGKATQTLPTYSIVRVVPQIHGLLQVWNFSVDTTMTGRYLITTEDTVIETPSHTLFLQQVQGWKGILASTGMYNLDQQGHFAITVTYKNGFAPPTYVRVNAVQAGLSLKY